MYPTSGVSATHDSPGTEVYYDGSVGELLRTRQGYTRASYTYALVRAVRVLETVLVAVRARRRVYSTLIRL